MPLANLTPEERDLVRRCVAAAVDGPFFKDWEFLALFGVNREGARGVAANWPPKDELDRDVFLTINNSLANLLGYPHGMADAVQGLTTASTSEIRSVFDRWREGHPLIRSSQTDAPKRD